MRRSLWFALVLLVGVVIAWIARSARESVPGHSTAASVVRAESTAGEDELSTPAEALVVLEPSTRPMREVVGESNPSARLHGRLVEAESGRPWQRELPLVLASHGNRVVEALRTELDGSFASTRAFPRGTVRALVNEPGTGKVLARHSEHFDPQSGEEWLIPVPQGVRSTGSAAEEKPTASVSGTVVDLGARPVEAAVVKLVRRGRAAPGGEPKRAPLCTSDEDGRFSADELVPGTYLLLAQGAFARAEPREVALVPGPNELCPIVLPSQPSPGAIRGVLISTTMGEDPWGMLLLRDLASQKQWAVSSDFKLLEADDGRTPFELAGIPAGEYELTLVPVDGREYEPRSVRVSPPMEGIEFRALTSSRQFGFRAHDARTGAEVPRLVVLGRIHEQWWGGSIDSGEPCLTPAYDRWFAFAPGYRPVSGDFSRAEPAPSKDESVELSLVDVAFARGFGAIFLFKDLESDALLVPQFNGAFGPNLAGVEVFADGAPVARSGSDGLAMVALERAPERLDFALPGWHAVASSEEDGLHFISMARD